MMVHIKAVLFQRDCGATTSFTTHVSLISVNEKLSNDESGNIFIAPGHPNDINIQLNWQASDHLTIEKTSGLEVKENESFYKGISITYE